MPSKNQKQHGFMGMSSTAKGRAILRSEGRKPAPPSVAREFLKADKGRHFKKGK